MRAGERELVVPFARSGHRQGRQGERPLPVERVEECRGITAREVRRVRLPALVAGGGLDQGTVDLVSAPFPRSVMLCVM